MNYIYPRIQYLDYHIISLLNDGISLHEPFTPYGFWSMAEYIDDQFYQLVYQFETQS